MPRQKAKAKKSKAKEKVFRHSRKIAQRIRYLREQGYEVLADELSDQRDS